MTFFPSLLGQASFFCQCSWLRLMGLFQQIVFSSTSSAAAAAASFPRIWEISSKRIIFTLSSAIKWKDFLSSNQNKRVLKGQKLKRYLSLVESFDLAFKVFKALGWTTQRYFGRLLQYSNECFDIKKYGSYLKKWCSSQPQPAVPLTIIQPVAVHGIYKWYNRRDLQDFYKINIIFLCHSVH